MSRGPRLGVDVGKARIGVAKSDPDGLLATPLETVARDLENETHLQRLREIVAEVEPLRVYVGYPLNMRGEHTPSTEDAIAVATALAETIDVPVRLIDERLTTVSATRQFQAAGRKASRSRDVIDQAAAVVLLQDAIDRERGGALPGKDLPTNSPVA
ncbi:Holliday junction resolvase RuvX [Gulosibacter bifidus]|uniref:Putative pre-16S rRNA nuclease n=1 Tax=Gulosibacter bifidus TaxID=272239 RepID=A0ABW5RGM8_9MICO|nr:Holliday junction resolvase RuvX [Gulosibacter bifidus]